MPESAQELNQLQSGLCVVIDVKFYSILRRIDQI